MLTIGILGGMGPAAGADFFQRLVIAHGAPRDQDHPPCLLYSATQIPDRTANLLGQGTNPTSDLVEAARLLERAGVDFIAIPCNSAHAYLSEIRKGVDIPILDMIAIAVDATKKRTPEVTRIGLLAASGTLRVGLYGDRLRQAGCEPVHPELGVQEEVMEAICDIKGGSTEPDERLLHAAANLAERGAEALIMGCTEVPLALDVADCPVPAIDANQTLVAAALGLATGGMEFQEIPAWEDPPEGSMPERG